MSRPIVLAAAILALVPACAGAEGAWRIGAWGGMMRTSMGDINTVLATNASALEEGWNASPDVVKSRSGWHAGVEATYEAFPGILLGVRTGWLAPENATLRAVIEDDRMAPLEVANGLSRLTVESWAVPVLAGGRYVMPLDEGLGFTAGLFMGYGKAWMRYSDYQSVAVGPSGFVNWTSLTDYVLEAEGGAFAMEALAGISWLAGPQVELGLDAGYRRFSPPLKASKDVDSDNDGRIDTPKGQVLGCEYLDQIRAGLSGLFFSLTFSYIL